MTRALVLVLLVGCRDRGVLVVGAPCPEPMSYGDPHWDAARGVCIEDAGRPTCAPRGQRAPTIRGTVPCVDDGPCVGDYGDFCGGGYCRDAESETLTICLEGAYLSGAPPHGEGPPDLRLQYSVSELRSGLVSGSAPPTPDRCLATWDTCFEVPAKVGLEGIFVGDVFIEDPETLETTRVQSFNQPLQRLVNRGCQRLQTNVYDYDLDAEADVEAWVSVWYP